MFQMIIPPHAEGTPPQPGQPQEITRSQATIERMHGCASRYCRTVHIVDARAGNSAWDGFVMIFDLIDFPEAKCCYAWKDKGRTDEEFAIVLGSSAVSSPETAVREWSDARPR